MKDMIKFKRELGVIKERWAWVGYWQTWTITYNNLFFTFKGFLQLQILESSSNMIVCTSVNIPWMFIRLFNSREIGSRGHGSQVWGWISSLVWRIHPMEAIQSLVAPLKKKMEEKLPSVRLYLEW
jgi:hypothetical protein